MIQCYVQMRTKLKLKRTKWFEKGRKKMRKTIVALVLGVCLVLPKSVFAEDDNYFGGIEYNVSLIGDAYVHPQVAINGNLVVLYNIYQDVPVGIVYAGARFDVADWYTTYVRLGVTADVPTEDLIGLDISLMQRFTLLGGDIDFLFQTDLIFHQDGFTYYGVYRFNVPESWFNMGLTTEQVHNEFFLGPHLGVTGGPVHLEVQFLTRVSEDASFTIRTVLEVALSGGLTKEDEE